MLRASVVLAGILLLVGAGLWVCLGRRVPEGVTAVVRRATVVDFVEGEQGILEPLEEAEITTQQRGTLSFVCEHGAFVKKGELLFKIDTEDYEAERRRRLLETTQEQHALVWCRERARQRLKEAQYAVLRAEEKAQLERLRLAELRKGPTETERLEAAVRHEAAANILRARREEEQILQELQAEGYVSREEVRQKELEVRCAEIELEQAAIQKAKLQETPTAVQLKAQTLAVREAERALKTAQEQSKTLQETTEIDIARQKMRLDQKEAELKRVEEEIRRCARYAEHEGHVLLKTRWGQRMHSGMRLRHQTPIMSLPNIERMKVVFKVSEEQMERVALDTGAEIRVPAIPEQVFRGKVIKIGIKAQDMFEDFSQETREHTGDARRKGKQVEVEIAGRHERLRPGLRAHVRLVLARYENVLTVPTSAVRRTPAGQTYLLVRRGGKWVQQTIAVAPSTRVEAVVLRGVREGEHVSLPVEPLLPPKGEAEESPSGLVRDQGGRTLPDSAGRQLAPDASIPPEGETPRRRSAGGERSRGMPGLDPRPAGDSPDRQRPRREDHQPRQPVTPTAKGPPGAHQP